MRAKNRPPLAAAATPMRGRLDVSELTAISGQVPRPSATSRRPRKVEAVSDAFFPQTMAALKTVQIYYPI